MLAATMSAVDVRPCWTLVDLVDPASPVAVSWEPSPALTDAAGAMDASYGLERRRIMQGPRVLSIRVTERSQLRVSLTRLQPLKHPASTFPSTSNVEVWFYPF